MASDYVDQVASGIIAQLREGTAPWVKPWAPGERFMPYNPTTGNPYRGMNALWLMSRAESHCYGDARWLTFRQSQEQGAQVRKGEKGTAIQFWKWQGLEPVRDADGKPVLDQDGNPRRELVRYERPRVMAAVVFNAGQIDGLPPAPDRPALPEWERHERAERILAQSGVGLRHRQGDRAFYRLADDTITLPERGQFATADRYYATALHEIGHATGHPSRLARDMAHPFGSEGYAREELRAEIASLMLGEQLGIGHDPGQHAAYVESWIRVLEKDPREVFRAAADAEKIATLVRSFEREQAIGVDHPAPLREQQAEPPAAIPASPPVMIEESHPAMTASSERTYLAVPYEEKDDAKQLGAKWDRGTKAWYVPAGVDVEAFSAWMPAKGSVCIAVDVHPAEQFAEALRACGLRPDGAVEMDGRMHRVPVEGDRGRERSGAYTAYADGHPAGFIQNFRTGAKVNWKASGPAAALDAQDRARLAAEAAQKRHDRAREREQQYERAAQQADALWAAATPVETHPYLAGKGVASHGLRQGVPGQAVTVADQDGKLRELSLAGQLLVPVADADGRLCSLQFVREDGGKMFMPNGRIEGGHFVIGDAGQPGPLLIAEGYATAATVHELTGAPVVVAFNAGNLLPVAQTYRALHPERPIYIAGDDDHRRAAEGKPNVGREKAEQAAAAIGGQALFPEFPAGSNGTDWNDLAQDLGRETARVGLQAAFVIAERELMMQSFAAARDRAERGQNLGASVAQAPILDRDRTPEMEMER